MPRGIRLLDDDRIRAGDPLATADAIKAIAAAVADLQAAVAGRSIAWRSVDYDATDFSTSGGTWTVQAADVTDYKIARIAADLLALQFLFVNTSTGAGTHDTLRIRLPRGLLIHPTANQVGVLGYVDNAGTSAVGLIVADGSAPTYLSLYKEPIPTAWAANAVNTTAVRGSILLQLAPVAGN